MIIVSLFRVLALIGFAISSWIGDTNMIIIFGVWFLYFAIEEKK